MKAEIINNKWWVSETCPERLMDAMELLIKKAGFTVLGGCEHFFQPHGYTGLVLLAESHLAYHTWPEHGKTYIELSSCSAEKQRIFVHNLPLILKVI
jgi:S-adenosylmethionine/arginine decarboxylase-like enzyme